MLLSSAQQLEQWLTPLSLCKISWFLCYIMMHLLQYQSKSLMIAGFNKLYPCLQRCYEVVLLDSSTLFYLENIIFSKITQKNTYFQRNTCKISPKIWKSPFGLPWWYSFICFCCPVFIFLVFCFSQRGGK